VRAARRLGFSPLPFDRLHEIGDLGAGDTKANWRRWQAGDALRRLHATGWQGTPGELATDKAADARTMIDQIEQAVDPFHWPVLIRVLIEGSDVLECRGGLPRVHAYAILLDRLRCALDRVAPIVGVI
jgi:hypothetical protein